MMLSAWIPFVSRRWFSRSRGSVHSLSSRLAAIGLAAGTAALVVVLSVMNGLQGGYIDALLEVSSFHVRVGPNAGSPPLDASGLKAAESILSGLKGVRSLLPFRESMVLIESPYGRISPIRMMVVPRDFALRDPGFARELGIDDSIFAKGGVVLGAEAARALGMRRGDSIDLLVPSSGVAEGVSVLGLARPLSSTFVSGFWQYDSGLALMSEDDLPSELLGQSGWAVTFGIKLADRQADAIFAAEAARRLAEAGLGSLSVQSWRDYNRAFFGALATEKGMMFLLLGLVFLVVAINIHHAMRRIVAMRAEDVAVLRSLGATEGEVAAVFVFSSLTSGVGGTFAGLLFGIFVSININGILAVLSQGLVVLESLFSRILPGSGSVPNLDSVFYLQELPVRLELPETFLVAFLALASALVATLSSARELGRLRPAEILRRE